MLEPVCLMNMEKLKGAECSNTLERGQPVVGHQHPGRLTCQAMPERNTWLFTAGEQETPARTSFLENDLF